MPRARNRSRPRSSAERGAPMILDTTFRRALLAAALAAFAGCASTASTDYDALATQMMKASFSDKGIATVERLNQDASNRECSQAEGKPLPEARAKAIEAENLKTIQWPSDGRFIGDWRNGEIAYGTIGPSLYRYGVNRGVSDPASPAAKAVVDYTWGKLWNSKAYNACSNMPRAG